MVVEYKWYGTIQYPRTVPYRIVPMMVTVVLCDNCAVARTNAEHYFFTHMRNHEKHFTPLKIEKKVMSIRIFGYTIIRKLTGAECLTEQTEKIEVTSVEAHTALCCRTT